MRKCFHCNSKQEKKMLPLPYVLRNRNNQEDFGDSSPTVEASSLGVEPGNLACFKKAMQQGSNVLGKKKQMERDNNPSVGYRSS